jgi:hypothetical protein
VRAPGHEAHAASRPGIDTGIRHKGCGRAPLRTILDREIGFLQ